MIPPIVRHGRDNPPYQSTHASCSRLDAPGHVGIIDITPTINSIKEIHLPICHPHWFRYCQIRLVVGFGKLVVVEPFLVLGPHFHEPKRPRFTVGVKDVKVHTLGFATTGSPDRTQSGQERLDVAGVDADGDMECRLGCLDGRRHVVSTLQGLMIGLGSLPPEGSVCSQYI